jgi:hypothetical protein
VYPGAGAGSRAADRHTARRRPAGNQRCPAAAPAHRPHRLGAGGGLVPDGTRLLTGGDGTVWVWDATSGLPVGFTIVTMPGDEIAVFGAIADQLVQASAGAGRWLGWNVVEDGRLTRPPAESFGTLPPLHPAAQSAEPA